MHVYIYYMYIYAIMKKLCPLGYHHNGLVATSIRGQSNIFNEVFLAVNYFCKKSSLVDTLLSIN